MKKAIIRLTVLCLCLGLVSCASTGAGGSSALYLEKKAFENSVYFVQVPVSSESRQEKDIIQRSASQISMRNKVFARFIDTGKQTSFLVDFDQNNLFALSEKLEILESVKTETGVQALVIYKGSPSFKNQKVSVSNKPGKNGNPAWVSAPPKSSAYYASVGSVLARSATADGFMNADSCAIAALAEHLSSPKISGTSKMYEAEIQGAYIARRWYNPSTKTYYSLAIAPRK